MLGAAAELIADELRWKLFWDDFQFAASYAAPIFFLFFVLRYLGIPSKSRPMIILILMIAWGNVLYSITDKWHGAMRVDSRLEYLDQFPFLIYEFGMGMYGSMLVVYALTLGAMVLLFRFWWSAQGYFKSQSALILLGLILPMLGGLGTVFLFSDSLIRDVSPFTFSIGNLIILFGLQRFRLFKIVPIANRTVLSHLEQLIFVVDSDGRIIHLNEKAAKRIEYLTEQPIGMRMDEVMKPYPDLLEQMQGVEDTQEVLSITRPDGSKVSYDSRIILLEDEAQQRIGQLLVLHDITELVSLQHELEDHRTRLEDLVQERTRDLEETNILLQEEIESRQKISKELRRNLAEKELLLREVNHRVRNTMQVILSILSMHVSQQENEEVSSALIDTQNRIHSMASAYDVLRGEGTRGLLTIQEYFRSIFQATLQRLNFMGKLNFDLDTGELEVPLNKAIPLGLILNELISNSLQYAGALKGDLEISIKSIPQGDDTIKLLYHDNGPGLENVKLWVQAEKLGFQLIQLLGEQLGAQLEILDEPGFRLSILFSPTDS